MRRQAPSRTCLQRFSTSHAGCAHKDPRRWSTLYRLLWRLTHGGERHLLSIPTDVDVRIVQGWCKAIGRDIHKMHAFVRFRLVGTDEDPAREGRGGDTAREQFVAWFEPEHRIVRLAAPLFHKPSRDDWSSHHRTNASLDVATLHSARCPARLPP